MKTNSEIYQLYLVTDRELMSTKTLEEAVEKAIDGGCTMVQLREKNLSSRDFYNTAKALKTFLQTRGVPLIINDRVDIALAVDADGVHIGQSDLPLHEARKILGNERIIGVTAPTLPLALEAEKMVLIISVLAQSLVQLPKKTLRKIRLKFSVKLHIQSKFP